MLTNYLAKLMGLSLVLMVASMIANKAATVQTMNALFTDSPLMFVTGVFTMMLGLAVVLGHNKWSGGPVPVLVTLYGWIATIKGLSFLLFPPPAQAAFFQAMHFEQYFYAYLAFSLAVGGYLIFGSLRGDAKLT